MFNMGVQELVVVFVIALLIFGPKRLPELARGLGKGLAEFRRASNDLRQSFNLDVETPRQPPPPPPRAKRADSTGDPRSADPREDREDGARPPQAIDSTVAEQLWGASDTAGTETEETQRSEAQPSEPKGAEDSGD